MNALGLVKSRLCCQIFSRDALLSFSAAKKDELLNREDLYFRTFDRSQFTTL